MVGRESRECWEGRAADAEAILAGTTGDTARHPSGEAESPSGRRLEGPPYKGPLLPLSPVPWGQEQQAHRPLVRAMAVGRGGGPSSRRARASVIFPDSLGIPDTSLRGLRTRTARSVRRSKSVPAVARILAETERGVRRQHPLPPPSSACVPHCLSTALARGEAPPQPRNVAVAVPARPALGGPWLSVWHLAWPRICPPAEPRPAPRPQTDPRCSAAAS